MNHPLTSHILPSSATLSDALTALNALRDGLMTLVVTDNAQRLQGTLTDGDVRRALLRGVGLGDNVMSAVNTRCHSIDAADIQPARIRQLRQDGIRLLPIIDHQRRLLRLIDIFRIHNLLPLKAVIIAGGMGERLRPLTLNTPKPLLPVAGRPIIDYNVMALIQVGVTDITVTTRYLAHKISEHFARPIEGVQVRCVCEDAPTGTIGSAALAGPYPGDGYTLVMNSDLLTTISFEDMYLHHADTQADITIAVTPYTVSVPYAILSIGDEGRVTGLDEKPTYSHYANAGIYIIANRLLAALQPNQRTDATTLIEQAIADGCRVSYYPIRGTWIDIGTPADYRQANDLMALAQGVNN